MYTRRATEPGRDELGALDPAAIARVREEAWPIRDADELTMRCVTAGS